MGKTTAVGIDLGTTYSCVSIWKQGVAEIISNDQGNRTTPSYVGFPEEGGERLIGDGAKNQANNNPLNTICDAKRFIGKKFNDPTVQRDIDMLPFKMKTYAQIGYCYAECGKPKVAMTYYKRAL